MVPTQGGTVNQFSSSCHPSPRSFHSAIARSKSARSIQTRRNRGGRTTGRSPEAIRSRNVQALIPLYASAAFKSRRRPVVERDAFRRRCSSTPPAVARSLCWSVMLPISVPISSYSAGCLCPGKLPNATEVAASGIKHYETASGTTAS